MIGGRCKHSNVFSRAVLMHEGLIHARREKSSRSGKVNNTFQSIHIGINSVGGLSEGGTPSPIPNLAVKPFSADGSSRVTVRKSRSLPTEFFISFATQESVTTLSFFYANTPHATYDGRHSIPQHTTPIRADSRNSRSPNNSRTIQDGLPNTCACAKIARH